MERKQFIKTCCIAGVGIPILGLGIQSCGSIYYAKYHKENNLIKIPMGEFIEQKKNKQKNRKFVLVKLDSLAFPICIYQIDAQNYHSSLLECTHRSCELTVGGDTFTCPCHGSEFTKEGIVLEGPAEANLKSFKTTHDEENIFVQLT